MYSVDFQDKEIIFVLICTFILHMKMTKMRFFLFTDATHSNIPSDLLELFNQKYIFVDQKEFHNSVPN